MYRDAAPDLLRPWPHDWDPKIAGDVDETQSWSHQQGKLAPRCQWYVSCVATAPRASADARVECAHRGVGISACGLKFSTPRRGAECRLPNHPLLFIVATLLFLLVFYQLPVRSFHRVPPNLLSSTARGRGCCYGRYGGRVGFCLHPRVPKALLPFSGCRLASVLALAARNSSCWRGRSRGRVCWEDKAAYPASTIAPCC